MRPVARALLALTLAHCAAAPPPRPVPARTVPMARDPIAPVLARITRADIATALVALPGPRHAIESRARLDAAAHYVTETLRALGYTVTRQSVTHGGGTADNLIADEPGAPGAPVAVIAAHYDTVARSPGADDNGTGVAALLAMARALSPRAITPPHVRVRFIAFAFEEEGLVGSHAYVAALSPAERARIAAVFVFDMLGYRTHAPDSQHYPAAMRVIPALRLAPTVGDYIGAMGLLDQPAPMRALHNAARYVPALHTETVSVPRALAVLVRDVRRSDHAPFWDAGIPAVMIGDSGDFRNPHYHQPSDTLDTLDLDFTVLIARWTTAALLLVHPAT